MSNIVEIHHDNDIGAYLRDLLVNDDQGLLTARRAILVYEDAQGTWRTSWMNTKPHHRSHVAALLIRESTSHVAHVLDT